MKKTWKTPTLEEYSIDELAKNIIVNASSFCASGFCVGTWCAGHGWFNG